MQIDVKTCRACGLELPLSGFYSNGSRGRRNQCGSCETAKAVARKDANPEKYAAINKRSYQKTAVKRRSDARQYYSDNKDRVLARCAKRRVEKGPELVLQTKQWRKQLKAEMFEAYGNKCSCCGETEPRFLTLEHTRRDGAQHRKAVGGFFQVYTDLKRRGWPTDGYTLLCWNCNCATRYGEPCPHRLMT